MKKLPKRSKKKKTLGDQLETIAPKLPWINLIIAGVCLSFLFFLLAFNFLFWTLRAPVQLPMAPDEGISSGQPLKIFLANLTGQQVTVFFTSQESGQASVYLGGKRFGDDRGDETIDYFHQITLDGLEPETDYSFKICSRLLCEAKSDGWYGVVDPAVVQVNPIKIKPEQIVKGGHPVSLKTGLALSIEEEAQEILYGRILGFNQAKVVVFDLIDDQTGTLSTLLATPVELSQWILDLANARTMEAEEFFPINDQTLINVRVISADGRETARAFFYGQIKDQSVDIKL